MTDLPKRSRRKDREVLRREIIEVAQKTFTSNGIKNVRMDDLASSMGISKRTLYEIFTDKETLLIEIFWYIRKERDIYLSNVMEREGSVIAVMFALYERELTELSSLHYNFFADLQKYPRLLELFKQIPTDYISNAYSYFTKGVEQGIFRDDINFEIVLRIMNMHKELMLYSDLNSRFSLVEVYTEIAKLHMRGITTEYGSQLFDNFLKNLNNE